MKNTIIVLLILAVLGLGAYVVYQKTQPNYNYQPSAETVITPPTPIPPAPTPPVVVDETADWQTYKNEEYGFELTYPANWHLTDNSSVGSDGKKYIGVMITSPIIRDYATYPGDPINYRILISGDKSHVSEVKGFGSDDPKFGKQSAWNVDSLVGNMTSERPEYEIGEKILSTFRFTK